MKIKRNVEIWTYKDIMSGWALFLIICCKIQSTYLDQTVSLAKSTKKFANNDEKLLHNRNQLKFERSTFNVTIPENSIGKTYAISKLHEDRIGLKIRKNCDVRFRIISGDRDKLFKAEERIVGNFAFLAIRTRTSNVVLNREKNEEYLLKIKAIITCSENAITLNYETDCLMHVQVLDRNDLSPLFFPIEYSVTVTEDLPIHSNIIKVTAEDADLGINGEIYYSFLNDNDYFAVHPTTGVISNVRQLTTISIKKLELVVLANDRGSIINHHNHQSSKARVYIQIKESNLHSPEIYVNTVSSAFTYNDYFTNKVYGIVKVTDKDEGRHGEINDLKIMSGDLDGNFRIVPTDKQGEYYLQLNKLVRLNNSTNTFNVTLRAEDRGIPKRFSFKLVPITIYVENRNAPIFTKQIYEVSIPETSPPNMPVIRLKVSDPDFGKSALVFLEIVGGNEGGEFRINPDSGMLYTQKRLDAEKKSFYTLTVSAIDLANIGNRKQSSAKVKINIIDINDNDPIFENINSTVLLNENELAGTYVTKVIARDDDSGENAYISYSIANLNDVPFDIDHFSGVIRTTTVIDYETMRRVYKLRVRASDWGLPFRRQTEVEILIKVVDINDNRPQFERVNCKGRIFRHAPIGIDIFTLSAIDFDVGDYITYRLIVGNEDGCFNLDPTTGVISIGCDLSDVVASHRHINVSATDGTHFSDEMTIYVELLKENNYEPFKHLDFSGYSNFECHETGVARKLADILAISEKNNMNNDKEITGDEYILLPSRYGQNLHDPEFVNFLLELSINESLSLGDTITWIKAKDRDLGYNGKLIYAISDGDMDSVFRIDPDSGELQLIGYLDRERQDEYVLNITVCDLGQPQKCDSKILSVIILDSNDNTPLFQKSLAQFQLAEDTPNGTLVFCLNTTDADIGQNAAVRYVMKTETKLFDLNESTGCIFVRGTLDREEKQDHELQIIAKDRGTPSLSAEALISINIEDVNDNAPIFGVQEVIFKVREDLPRGTVVAKIDASDFDAGTNGEILFSLKDDASNVSLFKIDKYNGVIRTQGYLDYETQQVHNLIVAAIDCGLPSLSSHMPVVIEIIDVNENRYAPEFDDFVYIGKVKENQPRGAVVMNITARDLDASGPDSEISYSIRAGDGLGVFSVNEKGSIRSLSHLDAETKNFYWLTLCAQDHAVVPLISCVQIYIDVENVNDNVPMTLKPVYYPTIPEGSPARTRIMQLNATDEDNDPLQLLHFKIISGNPEGFFSINTTTGELMTTERKLDRENQAEHILEISISDNGNPSLASTTRIVVIVDDINDHNPQFDQRFYKIQVPSTVIINTSIAQVQAVDNDVGENGRVSYSIKSGKGKNKFRIDSDNGLIFVTKFIESDGDYELIIRAEDHGSPKRSQTARLNVVVLPILEISPNAPIIKTQDSVVEVTESDRPGFLVTLIQAVDKDNDYLWYNISDGNERDEFYIGRDNGNILLSKSLDWEAQNSYNLTISVTDGSHVVQTHLFVHVVDTNDNRPQFTKDIYLVNISESIEEESIIMQLHATDQDEDKKIFYTLHGSRDPSSLLYFRVDSITGNVIVTQRLDYERNNCHVLTVIAKDQGTPAKRNYAKIIVLVHDHNDHAPEFSNKIVQRKIPESTTVGAKIVQLNAIDKDSGLNGEIKYTLVTGNVGNIFEIDSSIGIVYLAQSLNIMQIQEYMLQIKATDCGQPPLSSQIPIHIIVTMSENDPPRFSAPTVSVEIYENLPLGTFITVVEARSSSSVFYDIVNGNDDGLFYINHSTGMILVNLQIDYERFKFINITISGTNMASITSYQNVLIHVLDVNDNAPFFVQTEYFGHISEAAAVGTYIHRNDSQSSGLIFLNATDIDVGKNCLLDYTIMDDEAKRYFQVDSSTGTIKLLRKLDYETKEFFKFDVMVNDMGNPKLYSHTLATVHIKVINVNDCPPVFSKRDVNVTLYIPTYEGVQVTKVTAIDSDKDGYSEIRYDIVDGNIDNCFEINNSTGVITTRNVEKLNTFYTLHTRASDGLYSTIVQVDVIIEGSENSGISFRKSRYELSTVENSTKISTVGVINVVGNLLFENVEYRILNPTNLFEIGKTSGAIKTTGIVFDREVVDKYKLIVEAMSILYKNKQKYIRRSITHVDVCILDVNDNCPMFVNLPYYATVSQEDMKGTVVTQVKAIDLDSFENGEVRYEMKKGNGELFKVERKTGEIILKQPIEGHDRSYELIIAAYDGAIIPCSAEVSVSIKVVDRSMPIFDRQFYSDSVKEDVEIFSALSVSVQAESPMQRKLIYTIASGNENEFFEIDYRTAVLSVVNKLDFETQPRYELLVRATDSVSGVFAEITVSINVEDSNDCYPEIESDNYNISISENTLYGTQILKINATDRDTDANGALSYLIESVNGDLDSHYFLIDVQDGSLYLKHMLDYEECKHYHIIVIVKDHGTPLSLSSKSNIWVKVEDLNDNIPRFVEPSFSSKLSTLSTRGEFVTLAKAYDADDSDNLNLKYKIVDGNEHQVYAIEESNGLITLQNNQKLYNHKQTVLNVSVTDGIHTTYARVKIALLPENIHSPQFEKLVYEAAVQENQKSQQLIITVKAYDNDFGKYAAISYEIIGDDLNALFKIDKASGAIFTLHELDRETQTSYDLLVKATDGGGKFSYTSVKIKVYDENDNEPIFLLNEYKITLKDDTKPGSLVLKIEATDLDEGNNSLLIYAIEDGTFNEFYKDYFVMNTSGELNLIKSLENISYSFAQFFVRVTDNGSPPLNNKVPVSIQIVAANTTVPFFERSSLIINVEESTAPGSTLVKLKPIGNFSVKLYLATETKKFSITENGEILLLQTLDRELNSVEHIVAMAETITLPQLHARADVYFHIQDENDHHPKFGCAVYNVNIPENADKGTSLIKVTATDIDEGPNGDVRYVIEDETFSNLFEIDLYSGWIILLSALDRELQSEYYLNVGATDNGHPRHISKVPVAIMVTDYNDNPPVFKQQQESQQIDVFENALPGTVLYNFRLTDLDLEKNNFEYFILSGDNHSQFQIGNTGDLFVSKLLDYEYISNYNLTVAATEGKFVAYTNVSVTVKDVNDNFPICITPRYNITINEMTPIGTSLLKVNALDADGYANNKLRYYLSGNDSDDFYVDKDNGIIKVARVIDRERHPKYLLYAHVQDGQELSQECTSEVIISVNDVNDNKPEFSMAQYIASVPEDAQIQTIVTKIHATDKDFGQNRKISYFFTEANDFFNISQSSGIVKLIKTLDRENISMFNITIMAQDHGQPKMFSTTNLIIHVLDINDNPPEFNMKQYKTYVSENATINTEVLRVFATSKDIGVNAEISYYIIGGNEQNKFSIDKKTGIISTTSEIDFEKTKAFFLTVQAIDGGSPPLSNQAFVNVTILDVNDNQPQFAQNVYRVRISEDAKKGEKVLQIIATDEDSHQNGVIKYNIERGDRLKQFSIDEFTGYVYARDKLDRETISSYVLEIRACDTGSPELCNYIEINVDILDVNDNPPIFKNSNYSVILQENKALGFEVISFEINDADEPPNTSPYTYDFRSGNEGGFFRLEQDGSLKTAAKFNHRICDLYILQIRVFDNGTPPLYSDTWVAIQIIEESQYPPVITPLEITINSYEDDFAGGFLGKVYVTDQDTYDTFTFELMPTVDQTYSPLKLFNISRSNGDLFAIKNLDIGVYQINVTVSDGKYLSHTIVKLNVEMITPEMVQNAVVIKISKITPKDFILSYRKGFIRAIRDVMRCRQKDVVILSLGHVPQALLANVQISSNSTMLREQPSTNNVIMTINPRSPHNNLEIVLAVRKQQIVPTSEAYFSSEDIRNLLAKKFEQIQESSNLIIEKLITNECTTAFHCLHGLCKNQIVLNKSKLSTYHTDVVSFVTPTYKLVSVCLCRQGYDGKNCDEPINACSSDPCPLQKQCLPANSTTGYQCICPTGYTGHFCEIKSLQCVNTSCSTILTSVSFSGKSYAHYKINKSMARNAVESQFLFSFRIRTVQQSGTLLYASGKIDYSIIEILNGAAQYRFDLGSGEGIISVSSVNISDGEWHHISLERMFNSAKLLVDNKHASQGSAPGVNVILNLQTNDIFVGAEVKPHQTIIGYEDIQRGFVGCMTDINIANEALPLYISGGSTIAALKRFTNVEFSCDPSSVLVSLGVCGTQPCLNSGLCKDLGNTNFKCICPERFTGKLCEIDLDPCASSPCLYAGRCEYLNPSNYSCSCPLHLSGKRCEYGQFCTPNPCKNGGICEEGDGIPHCMCRGYTGPTCEIDVDECENQPCGSGATCINEAGSFRCICPSYLTGASCGDPLYSNSISTKLRNFSIEHITGIISGVTFVFVFCILILCCILFKKNLTKRDNSTRIKNSYREATLNSLLEKEKNNKQNAKLSNLEVNHRPISYTPSSTDNMFSTNSNFVNNLDILRSYGSAGDELENIPIEYQKISLNNQNVNLNNENMAEGDPSSYKRDWCDQMQLKTFCENKLNNEKSMDFNMPLNRLTTLKPSCGKLIQVAMPNVCQTNYGGEYSSLGQYHWDCSDWVRNSQNPLPDITEVPGAEIADSSSFQSNDSNESKPRSYVVPNTAIRINPARDIATLEEELATDCVDSELRDCIQPFQLPLLNSNSMSRLSPIYYSENEDYKSNSGKMYLRHPDSYLPPLHHLSETEGESSANDIYEGKNSTLDPAKRKISENSESEYLCNNHKSHYNSNLSVHLCEIEDSELEEFLPKDEKK
ncbi:fat-like cadherin-related tumor suppressor homolog isoform X2 [Glossina fuscipes]|uniref:Fat-like cadherin-related tumor suppressor homolog isoform X2 n=1 Tax=Glossina fuscipes TaxID=7396 RepID=A0A9C6DS94_9MUSC|nr:fat-like cadherin-related tumor suppressor homolog isoform X2 [Glossina fuscipes]